MRQQVLKDRREQSLHLRFRNKSDAVLEEDPATPNKIQGLREMNLVVVRAAEQSNGSIM